MDDKNQEKDEDGKKKQNIEGGKADDDNIKKQPIEKEKVSDNDKSFFDSSSSSPEEWEDIASENLEFNGKKEAPVVVAEVDKTLNEKLPKNRFESICLDANDDDSPEDSTQESEKVSKTPSSETNEKSIISKESTDVMNPVAADPSDSNVSLDTVVLSEEVDIPPPEEVQHNLDKMVLGFYPEEIHKHSKAPPTPEPEHHPNKPKLLLNLNTNTNIPTTTITATTTDNNNSEIESDSVDTPRPEEMMKVSDKMILGFDLDAYKKKKGIDEGKIIPEEIEDEEDQAEEEDEDESNGDDTSSPNDQPTSTSTSSGTSSDETTDDDSDSSSAEKKIDKSHIGLSKEFENIQQQQNQETIKIEKIENKQPYELEDITVSEVIDESLEEQIQNKEVELENFERIKNLLKAEAKEMDKIMEDSKLEQNETKEADDGSNISEKSEDSDGSEENESEPEKSWQLKTAEENTNRKEGLPKVLAEATTKKFEKMETMEAGDDGKDVNQKRKLKASKDAENKGISDSDFSSSSATSLNEENVLPADNKKVIGEQQQQEEEVKIASTGGSESEGQIGIEVAGIQRTDIRDNKRKRRETTSPRPQDLIGALKLASINNQPKPKFVYQHSLETPGSYITVPPSTPSDAFEASPKLNKSVSPEFETTPGPEEFHEVAIDVPDVKRHIAFDLDDDLTASIKKRIADEDDDETKQIYEKSRLEKFINYLLCRRDLVDAILTEKPVKFWDLFKYGSRTDTILVILGLLLAAVCGICQPVFAILSGRLANTLLLLEIDDPQFFAEGTQACILFVVIGAFLVVIAFAQFLCFNIACTRITRRIRNAYLRSILRQNPAWFEKNHSGALNTKLNDNIERIYEGIGDKLGLLTRNMVQYITGIIVALVVSWEMALPLMIFSPIITFCMAFSGRKISKASRDEMEVYGNAGCIAEEAITAYRTVAAFNAQETEVARYKKELERGVQAGVRKAVYTGALSGVMLALVMIFMGSALLYGTFLHSIGIIKTPGDVFIVLMAIMSGAYHLGNASPHLMVLLTARVAAASVYKTISRIPKIDPYSAQGRKLYDLQGKIIFKNVSFRYPSRPETKVLKSFSFSCNAGQTIALVGQSGSGKSTIVGILNRLYEFETGNVSLDGVDIRELNVKWLRTVIGTVQQEPIIFNDTVENNIKLGCDSLTEKEMVEACKMANAHDFIESLPEGYNTRIGEGGVQLSGGQKQRIAIARTLARNPKILLLDEATSALDTHSEAMVQAALNNASKNRTTIVIAHRLSTIRDADRIIVMHKGRFVEMGTHNDLLARKGAYAKLVQAQELNMGDGDDDEKKADSEEDEGGSIEENLMSPDKPSANLTLASKQVRESVRQSFQRDFLASDHMGDAETEAYNIELEKSGYKKASFGQIFLDAKELWPLLGVALAICFFNALAMPVNAFIYGQAFQMFEDGRKDNVGDAFMFFLFFVALGVVALFASFATTYLFGKIGEKLTMSMRVRAFRSIIHQDGSYFDNPAHTPGKLITRLATDAPNVKASMDTRLARVAQGILALLAAVVISVFMDWKFALTCSLAFVFLGIFQFAIAKIAHSHAVKFAQSDEAGRVAIEAIENVRTIQLLTSELAVHQVFTDCSLKRQRAETRKAPIEALNFATTHGLQYFTLAFCYMMGFIFVINGLTNKITLFQVVQTMYFGAIAVLQATEFFPEFVKSRLAASLMYAIINRQPRTGKLDSGERISIEGDVTFENVYFAYPMRPKHAVMKGISLQARPGQTIAMVGPSGSGKSTVIALLERFYDPSVGAVKIDGKDLKSLNLWEIRRQMSLVEQQPRLFSGTIKENIAYGLNLNEISMDEIIDAANLANAASFISTLPLGYDTPLGEKGAQLSGGQKQRIAIARAVIRKPKILLLDEATSALDSNSEKAVQDALDKARLGRTCITIAHRLSSIQNSDAIIFVENGKVRERGTHLELVQQQGKYYNLTQQQYLGVQ